MKRHVSEISHVIKIGERYFCHFGKKNRVMTAWCLTGATTYQAQDVNSVFEKLVDLGKKAVILRIGVIEELNIESKPLVSATTQPLQGFSDVEFDAEAPFQ